MSSLNNTPVTLSGIRHRAKSLKKSEGISLTAARNAAAILAGYQNYQHALNVLSAKPLHKLTIACHWKDPKTGRKGVEKTTVALTAPWVQVIGGSSRLRHCSRTGFLQPNGPDELRCYFSSVDNQYQARWWTCQGARAFQFMDATGLRPTNARSKPYPKKAGTYPQIPGQDHPSFWYEPISKSYVIADEPYTGALNAEKNASERNNWCEEHSYTKVTPSWPGMYNPEGETQIYLFSPLSNAKLLDVIKAKLDALDLISAENWQGISS